MKSALPFLMFQGEAGTALDFYLSTFPGAALRDRVDDADGTLQRATLVLAGQAVMIFDSPPVYAFTYTPSSSIFIECADEEEIGQLSAALAGDGEILMPLGDHGFNRLYTWVQDRFGVSWQLNLS